MVRDFYDSQGITDQKTVVFSDSLDIDHCLEYKTIAEEAGFTPAFGVGTFFTSESSHCPAQTISSYRDGLMSKQMIFSISQTA